MTRRRAALLALAAAAAAPRALRAQGATITGTAAYRERIALPPGAVLEVELVDIARADAPAERIAATRIEVQGQVPIPFTLEYDPARLRPQGRYALQARLSVNGRLAWRNDRIIPVPPGAPPGPVEIPLVRVRQPASGPAPADRAALVGHSWVAEDIGGRGVVDRLRTEITFSAEGRAYGSGGCNRFTGGYELDGATLRLGHMASTQMACVPAAMDQERRFHEALAAVTGWRLDGSILHLTGAAGATLIRLSRAG